MALTIDDFANPFFDKMPPKKRMIRARKDIEHLIEDNFRNDLAEENYFMNPDDSFAEESYMTEDFDSKEEPVIECVTVTDQFNTVGYTYHLLDGMLSVNYFDDKKNENVCLIEKKISTYEDFDKCLKSADRKIAKYKHK